MSLLALAGATAAADHLSLRYFRLAHPSETLPILFQISLIVPIWRSAGIARQLSTGAAGLAGGLAIWMSAFLVELADPTMHSFVVGTIRCCAALVSLAICVAI